MRSLSAHENRSNRPFGHRLALAAGLLLTALAGLGQVMPVHRRPVPPANSLWTPTSVPTIRYWWVSGDLAANSNITNWTDRIQSYVAYQPNTNNSPSNTSSGLYFNGTNTYLLLNGPFPSTNYVYTNQMSFMAVLKPLTIPSSGTWAGILGTNDSFTFGLHNTGAYYYLGQIGSTDFGAWQNNTPMDVICTYKPSTNVFYTNGVKVSIAVGDLSFPFYIKYVATGQGNYYKGYISEIMWFSNSITASEAAQLHSYATNKYGYSP